MLRRIWTAKPLVVQWPAGLELVLPESSKKIMSALVQLVRSCFPSIAEMLYYHKAFGKLQMSYDTSWYGIPTFNLNFMNHHVGVSTQIYQGVLWKSPAFTSTSNSMQIHSSTTENPKIRRLVEKYHLPLEVSRHRSFDCELVGDTYRRLTNNKVTAFSIWIPFHRFSHLCEHHFPTINR